MQKSLVFFSLCAIVALFFSLHLSAQTAPPPTPVTQIQVTPTQSMQQELDVLNDRIAVLEDVEDDLGRLVILEILDYLWIVVFAIIIFVFRDPIATVIRNVNRTQIEIGGIRYTAETLKDDIIAREILKFGIDLASVDNDISREELDYLRQVASSMKQGLDKLSQDDREHVLDRAIQIAMADLEFRQEEYEAIMRKATELDVPIVTIDEMIRTQCALRRIELPPQLANGDGTP